MFFSTSELNRYLLPYQVLLREAVLLKWLTYVRDICLTDSISGLASCVLKAVEQWDFFHSSLLWSEISERARFIFVRRDGPHLSPAFSWGRLGLSSLSRAMLDFLTPFSLVLMSLFLSYYHSKIVPWGQRVDRE